MVLFLATCASALQLAATLSPAELADVRARGLPATGIDQAISAARLRAVDIAFNGLRTSDLTRELFDNWYSGVAVPLIADAMASRR